MKFSYSSLMPTCAVNTSRHPSPPPPRTEFVGICVMVLFFAFAILAPVLLRRLIRWFRGRGPLATKGSWTPPPANAEALRLALRSATMNPAMVPPGHPHPVCGLARNEADNLINECILRSGRSVYSVQNSFRDVARKFAGSHHHYTSRDLVRAPYADPVPPRATLKFINVDYYVDWDDYLWLGRPVMLYTFAPESPAGATKEYTWCTDASNRVTMTVAGGGIYTHPLWDYSVDYFTHRVGNRITVWGVETAATNDPNFRIVSLTPLRCHHVRPFPLFPRPPPLAPLKRRVLVTSSVTLASTSRTMVAHTVTLAGEHIAPLGSPQAGFIPADTCAAIRSRHSSKALDIHSLNTLISAAFPSDPRLSSCLTALAWRCLPCDPPNRPPLAHACTIIGYTATSEETLDDFSPVRATARMITPPLYGYPRAPLRTRDNELWTLRDRLQAVSNHAPIPPEFVASIDEFITYLATELVPIGLDEVAARQNKPTQRAGNERAAWFADRMPPIVVKAFQKAELYPEEKDPRNISTLPREHSYHYSRYTLPLSDHFKRFEWYGFGRDNIAVARQVMRICTRSRTIVETDFSRFDGTHSDALYDLELLLLERCFPHNVAEVRRLQKLERQAPARTSSGLRYPVDGSRLSGSSDTSVMNTFCNALISYVALRESGVPASRAPALLGLYAGDDGLIGDVPAATVAHVAKRFGLRIKAVDRPASSPVTFLARYYPAPQTDPGSICDLKRQLPKLAATTNMDPNVPLGRLLANKATGLLVTDPETPIVRAWCRAVLRIFPEHFPHATPEAYLARAGPCPDRKSVV